MKKYICVTMALFAFATIAKAENINLTADNRVEWHQKENKMVAIGNAVASKKDLSIRADEMTGFYGKEGKQSGITSVYAKGNVIMKSPKANAQGSSLDYNLKKDIIILKGSPAKIKTDKETIEATDNITYYPSEQKAIASGDVTITDKDNNKVYSKELISYFTKNKSGNMEIEKVDISDKVKIVTKQAIVTADKGIYLPKEGLIKLFDNIVISQDGNFLKGDVAESNLNTGVTKLISGTKGGRVSGVFKEKEKKNEKNQ